MKLPTSSQSAAAVAGALALAIALSSCGGQEPRSDAGHTTYVSVAAPDYATVEELSGNSSLYVRGTVGPVVARETDSGGVANTRGIPVKFVELTITETSDAAVAAVGQVVPVVWSDFGKDVKFEQDSELVAGTEVLIFAHPVTSKEAVGIDSVDFFLSPVGGENGVFDIQGDVANARSQMLTSLTPGEPAPGKSDGLQAPIDSVISTANVALK